MVKVFFPIVQYSVLLELAKLPEPGDIIKITDENLFEMGRGLENRQQFIEFGHFVTVRKRLDEDTGWHGKDEVYPSFACSISMNS